MGKIEYEKTTAKGSPIELTLLSNNHSDSNGINVKA